MRLRVTPRGTHPPPRTEKGQPPLLLGHSCPAGPHRERTCKPATTTAQHRTTTNQARTSSADVVYAWLVCSVIQHHFLHSHVTRRQRANGRKAGATNLLEHRRRNAWRRLNANLAVPAHTRQVARKATRREVSGPPTTSTVSLRTTYVGPRACNPLVPSMAYACMHRTDLHRVMPRVALGTVAAGNAAGVAE